MDDKDRIFTTSDPLGRSIYLKTETWNEHIADKHIEVEPNVILKNIEQPGFILQNTKPDRDNQGQIVIDKTRQDYVSMIIFNERMYAIKTIVQFETNTEGFIVTNYILRKCSEIKTEGGVIYDGSENKNATRFIKI